MSTSGEQDAPVAMTGKIGLDRGKVIGVIKDQEPGVETFLQPLFDGVRQRVRIGFVESSQGREQ